jgi:hypothetical protein
MYDRAADGASTTLNVINHYLFKGAVLSFYLRSGPKSSHLLTVNRFHRFLRGQRQPVRHHLPNPLSLASTNAHLKGQADITVSLAAGKLSHLRTSMSASP